MRVAAAVGSALVAGCFFGPRSPYDPERLSRELGPSFVRTIGCLDVGVVPRGAHGLEKVDVHVGNRCKNPELFDLRKLRIQGVDAHGREMRVTLSDPRNEVARLHVAGAERGRERFRLVVDDVRTRSLYRLCFDLSGVVPNARGTPPSPLCFERNQEDAWIGDS